RAAHRWSCRPGQIRLTNQPLNRRTPHPLPLPASGERESEAKLKTGGGLIRPAAKNQFSAKPNILAALPEVILCRSAFGPPANLRSRNCCEFGKVASDCG